MNSAIRSQSLLDRDVIEEPSSSSIPSLRTSKSENPVSLEVEHGADDIRLNSRSWSFSLGNNGSKPSTVALWEHRNKSDQHFCSNLVELVPVNSSSESEDSLSVEEDDLVAVLLEEDDDDDEENKVAAEIVPLSRHPKVAKSGSHPLSTALERKKSNVTEQQQQQQQQQQQDVSAGCAYDCWADHITNFFCPVERHNVETSSLKSLPLEESSAPVSSSHPTPTNNSISVCDPEALNLQLFPPPSETVEDDRSSFLFSFWDNSAEETERLRRLCLEQKEQRTPQNRSRWSQKQKDRYLQQLLDTWHPPLLDEHIHLSSSSNSDHTSTAPWLGKSRMFNRSKSFTHRTKKSVSVQPQHPVCYDSDPEQAFIGKRHRMKSLLQPLNRRSNSSYPQRHSSMTLHAGVVADCDVDDVAISSDVTDKSQRSTTSTISICTQGGDGSTSYETAQNSLVIQPPLAPRHCDRISFDFVTTNGDRKQDCGETTAEESMLTTSRRSNESLSTAADAGEDTAPIEQPVRAITTMESSVLSDKTNTTAPSLSSPEEVQRPRQPLHHVHMPLPVRCEPPFFQAPTRWTEFHLLYSAMDDFTKVHVQELSNVRFPLIWHRPANIMKEASNNGSPAPKTPSPVACHGVFEVGAHLDHMVVQPKFTWSPVLQPNLEENRKILLSGSQPHCVELLSIIRVNTPSPNQRTSSTGNGWDRSLYPFCRLDRTVCVTTNDLNHPYLVFEARSTNERDWLVVALKLIVARLASIIIVCDEDMLLEFFSPYSALLGLEDDDDDSDDEFEEGEQCKKIAPARDALNTLTLGNKPPRCPIQTIVRDGGEGGDRQDVSMDDDEEDMANDFPTDDDED